jgi:undecaprenyl diphosphate synthase
MINKLYGRRLLREINSGKKVKNILLVIESGDLLSARGPAKLKSFARWCSGLEINPIVYVSAAGVDAVGVDPNNVLTDGVIKAISPDFDLFLYTKSETKHIPGTSPVAVHVSVGFGGKDELVRATREIMKKVESGEVNPGNIDEKMVEEHLVFKAEPDLIIRAGGRLTDFLIWQSVYSELYFTDIDWGNFRRIDLLRAIRDYQKRQRRFGR